MSTYYTKQTTIFISIRLYWRLEKNIAKLRLYWRGE